MSENVTFFKVLFRDSFVLDVVASLSVHYTLIDFLPVQNFHLLCNYLGMEKRIPVMSFSRATIREERDHKVLALCDLKSISVSEIAGLFVQQFNLLDYLVLEVISLVNILPGPW